MPEHLTSKLLSVRDAAEYCGVGVSTFWRKCKLGLVPQPLRIGRRALWEIEVLDQFITDLRAKTTGK